MNPLRLSIFRIFGTPSSLKPVEKTADQQKQDIADAIQKAAQKTTDSLTDRNRSAFDIARRMGG